MGLDCKQRFNIIALFRLMMALSSHDKVHLFRHDYEEVHWNRNRQNEDLPDSPGFPSECSDAEVRLVLSCAWLLLLVFWRVRCLLMPTAWPTRPSPRCKMSCWTALGVCLRCPAHSGDMCRTVRTFMRRNMPRPTQKLRFVASCGSHFVP